MIRKLLIPALAATLLAGCITDYGYRGYGGSGDYYYGRPSVEYRYYGGYGGGYGGYYGGWGGYYPYAYPYRYGYGYPYRYAYPYRHGYGPYGYPGYRAPYYNYPRYRGHGGGHGYGNGYYNNGNHPNRPGWSGQGPRPQPGVQPGPRPGGRPGSAVRPTDPNASNEPRQAPRNDAPRRPSSGRERAPRHEP
jgi:hypothetical protein